MKTSDSYLKVNRNIYPDAVTCNRMRLIGPKSGQLGPINQKKISVCEKNVAAFLCCGKVL